MKSSELIIIAPDSFKGTISSADAGEIIAEAFKSAACDIGASPPRFSRLIMADGGEGTTAALGAKLIYKDVCGPDALISLKGEPTGQRVKGFFGILDAEDGIAGVVELAAAAALTQSERRNPELATTYGVGELIKAALDFGAKRLILTLGGSATNDGGAGMAAALGAVFTDKDGRSFIPTGGSLSDIAKIDLSGLDSRLAGTDVDVMCDVKFPMAGARGASANFAPQKGADAAMVERLDRGLRHLAALWVESGLCSADILELEGGGAAGGAGAGAAVFLGGRLRPGAEVVLDAADFDGLLKEAALVVTGEGKFDHTSLNGKAVGAAAARAKAAGVPVLVIAGSVDILPPELLSEYGVTSVLCSQRGAVRPEELAGRAKGDLYEAAYHAARLWYGARRG